MTRSPDVNFTQLPGKPSCLTLSSHTTCRRRAKSIDCALQALTGEQIAQQAAGKMKLGCETLVSLRHRLRDGQWFDAPCVE